MTYPRPRTARKILVASLGVATMSYVISCGGGFDTAGDGGLDAPSDGIGPGTEGSTSGGGFGEGSTSGGSSDGSLMDHRTIDDSPVANLVAVDVRPKDASVDTIDDFPVANLVVIPDSTTIDEFPVANLVVTPDF